MNKYDAKLTFEQNFYLISLSKMFLIAFVGVEEPQTELVLYQMKLAPKLR